jgi:hypothetical protein
LEIDQQIFLSNWNGSIVQCKRASCDNAKFNRKKKQKKTKKTKKQKKTVWVIFHHINKNNTIVFCFFLLLGG